MASRNGPVVPEGRPENTAQKHLSFVLYLSLPAKPPSSAGGFPLGFFPWWSPRGCRPLSEKAAHVPGRGGADEREHGGAEQPRAAWPRWLRASVPASCPGHRGAARGGRQPGSRFPRTRGRRDQKAARCSVDTWRLRGPLWGAGPSQPRRRRWHLCGKPFPNGQGPVAASVAHCLLVMSDSRFVASGSLRTAPVSVRTRLCPSAPAALSSCDGSGSRGGRAPRTGFSHRSAGWKLGFV